jgi:ubiquinone/menaquinone biosynthesis C-methylase UbiE
MERIPGPLASSYEKATRMAIDSYYSPVAEEIVTVLNKGCLLDLGTGPGYLPIEIAKRSPAVRIVGIDLSRKLVQMARSHASKAGLGDRLTFQFGNASRLEFQDSSFDMVISTGMLHSLKDPIKVLREIYRVLKGNGEAWLYDPAKISSQVDREKWKKSLTWREKFFLWLYKWLGLHKPIDMYTREQVIAMIEQTHFRHYTIEERPQEIKIKLRKGEGLPMSAW